MGVYVHIPFCEEKCYYCDFHSVVVGDKRAFSAMTSSYLVSLRREAHYYRSVWGDRPLSTLFLGGGTPSLLPAEELASLIAFLLEELPFVPRPEITIEANPNSLTVKGANILAQAGVNRVSLGAQAFQDSLLKTLGRVHRADHIKQGVYALREAGIRDINLDLMFGLPAQTTEQWISTLENALELVPTHISSYGLILEPKTPFARWNELGLLEVPSDDVQAEMYDLARNLVIRAGYDHYEISNYCLSGKHSRHNLLYWHNEPFIGLGSGATGYVQGLRYTNAADIGLYINSWKQGAPRYDASEEVAQDQEMDETMMVGMRLLRGVSEDRFRKRYLVSYWDVYSEIILDLLERELVEFSDGYLRVSERGLFLENQVSGAFLR